MSDCMTCDHPPHDEVCEARVLDIDGILTTKRPCGCGPFRRHPDCIYCGQDHPAATACPFPDDDPKAGASVPWSL